MDASALIRLVEESAIEGAKAEVARELAEWHAVFHVSAPSILAYELANVVHHKHRDAFDDDVEERLSLVRTMLVAVSLVPPDGAATARIGALTESLDLSAYDAAYVELAERDEDSVLVTEDVALRQKAALALGKERVWGLTQRSRAPA